MMIMMGSNWQEKGRGEELQHCLFVQEKKFAKSPEILLPKIIS